MKRLCFLLFILLVIVLMGFFYLVAGDQLCYAEGWSTFYYDSFFVDQVVSSDGWTGVLKCFLLQFFAVKWIGAAVLTSVMLILEVLLAMIVFRLSKSKIMIGATIVVPLVCAYMLAGWLAGTSPINPESKKLMVLSNSVRSENWDNIISICKDDSPVNNLLYQNMLNMALAEEERLADGLMNEPVVDIRSVYVNEISNHYIAAHLSDVYYSMGHIAQSQRYAFEANEKFDNFSPRMLQRLVITNIIYGQYAVAEKYLYWLRKTMFYDQWCDRYSAFLYNDEAVEADAELGMKRKCLFADNRFSGIRGLDDDLLNVARNTRGTKQCMVTLNYLGSLYILARYEEQFLSMCEEFSPQLKSNGKLPVCFEQYYNHLMKK